MRRFHLRTSKFSVDLMAHHPLRLAVMVNLVRAGGRDRYQTVCRIIEPVCKATQQSIHAQCCILERAGYVATDIILAGRGNPRKWLELTQAGRDALTNYRTAILEMIDGPQPAMPLPASNAMEGVNTS